jgi:hypothetical protein
VKKKMKTKLAAMAFIVMAAIMLSSLYSAMATVQTPPLTVSEQGVVWTVDVNILGRSGKEVILNSIVCSWYNNDGTTGVIKPYKISVTDSQIKLWFDPLATGEFAFPETVDHNNFYADLEGGGNIWYQAGPGWTWGRR